jgi:hypothetical protein
MRLRKESPIYINYSVLNLFFFIQLGSAGMFFPLLNLEYVKKSHAAFINLESDGFSSFLGGDASLHNEELYRATDYLLNQTIPIFAPNFVLLCRVREIYISTPRFVLSCWGTVLPLFLLCCRYIFYSCT